MILPKNIIHVFCDGGVRGNGKEYSIGASAFILHLNGKEKESYHAERKTTNNAEELYAILSALQTLKRYDLPVIVYSDSQYAINCITVWMKKWKKNNFKTVENKVVKNRDLLVYLDEIVSNFENIEFVKVKGHSDDEYNDRVDSLCNKAMNELEEIIKQKNSNINQFLEEKNNE